MSRVDDGVVGDTRGSYVLPLNTSPRVLLSEKETVAGIHRDDEAPYGLGVEEGTGIDSWGLVLDCGSRRRGGRAGVKVGSKTKARLAPDVSKEDVGLPWAEKLGEKEVRSNCSCQKIRKVGTFSVIHSTRTSV